ncbi:ABC transporter ATP-binding protein [Prevotella aurantiaca]|jgi:ABC transporter, ATP-binding protein|uniref:ABC transporter ATP-binding protein n=1 Tax=Prevotella aurantiaca TaxID=596085 RepID=A0A930N1P5_9BACT|nr:ABC transporter ATP-binding protein [Prevotella aurantiaca]MBF1384822.1 ABC transporter ATP-binding protein [Prevotella aurantiaca]
MIEIKNLVFSYPGNKKKVFDGLNLTLQGNQVYGLLGKNGMGKSTLLYLISGLLRPKGGEVYIDGMEAKKRHPEMLREIYVVPEEYNLPDLTLKQYVKVHQDFYPRFSEEILFNCLKDFEMESDINFKHLSMGQKKKIYMSFAVASCCQLLLMDEPTNGLDIPSKALFRKVIAGNLPADSSLIISTHQVHDVEQLLDHVFILNNSEMLVNASVEDIAKEYEFSYRNSNEMDSSVLYAEPSLQGNAVIARRKPDSPETTINLELLFNAATLGKL